VILISDISISNINIIVHIKTIEFD